MILILDDDKRVSEVESYALTNAGYEVVLVGDERELFERIGSAFIPLIHFLLCAFKCFQNRICVNGNFVFDYRCNLLAGLSVTDNSIAV